MNELRSNHVMNATAELPEVAVVAERAAGGRRSGGRHAAGGEDVWSLSALLQTTLDVEKVIELFARELAKPIPYDSFEYRNPDRGLHIHIGSAARHSVSYRMSLDTRPLGTIQMTRARPFDDGEIARIEILISGMIYALRNALLYQEALAAAQQDPLTGVANRAVLDNSLQREVSLARRHALPLSVLMIDIDKFKRINDTHGHAAGDRVLLTMAQGIKNCVRNTDVFARYGGEEFVVILPGTDVVGAQLLADRICRRVAELHCALPAPGENSLNFTISVGVASLGDDQSGSALLDRADQAMYLAKQRGGNGVAVA